MARVGERVAAACRSAGVPADSIHLVAACKSVPAEKVRQAMEAGIRRIGENRIQEAEAKWKALSDLPGERHFLGSLQRNKAARAVRLCDLIQSLDRLELAEALDRHAGAGGKIQRCLVEVNIAGEPTKSGVRPEELPEFLGRLSGFRHLQVEGLMAVPPYAENPEEALVHFQRMRRLFETAPTGQNIRMRYLSMGMSHDFEVAIRAGANMIRIGTAIFGPRPAG